MSIIGATIKKTQSTRTNARQHCTCTDDFEVAIFLTETNTRHSILYKHKHARDKTQTRLRSNSKKLTGGGEGTSREAAIDLGGDDDKADDGEGDAAGIELIQTADGDEIPILRREESEGSDDAAPVSLHDIPEAPESGLDEGTTAARGTKRRRRQPARSGAVVLDEDDNAEDSSVKAPGNGDGDYVVVDSEDENSSRDGDDSQAEDGIRPPKRARAGGGEKEGEKKKKVALDVSYEGFAIYGRVLCLVVKRRGNAPLSGARSAAAAASAASSGSGKAPAASSTLRRGVAAGGGGQARMENWIASTQIMPEAEQAEEG